MILRWRRLPPTWVSLFLSVIIAPMLESMSPLASSSPLWLKPRKPSWSLPSCWVPPSDCTEARGTKRWRPCHRRETQVPGQRLGVNGLGFLGIVQVADSCKMSLYHSATVFALWVCMDTCAIADIHVNLKEMESWTDRLKEELCPYPSLRRKQEKLRRTFYVLKRL